MRSEPIGFKSKYRHVMDSLFHDREIIFRSRKKHYSRYIYIEEWKQKLVVALILGSVLTLTVLYALSFIRLYTAEHRIETMRESSVVFRDVYHDVQELYNDIEAVRGFNYNSPETIRVMNDWLNNSKLSRLLEKIEGELAAGEKIQESDGVLLMTRQEMTHEIQNLRAFNDNLAREKAALKNSLSTLKSNHGELKGAYLTVLDENDELRTGMNQIRERFYTREEIGEQAETVLLEFVTELRQIAGHAPDSSLEPDANGLLVEAENLIQAIAQTQESQRKVLEREIQRIDYSVASIGNIIDMSGLTINKLTKIGMLPLQKGVGGPSIAIDDDDLRTNDLLNLRQDELEYQLNKLQAMQSFVHCMPMTMPIDAHRIGSEFGFRVNPFTGRGREMHYGLDFVAWFNTPIWATSSGQVVYVGKRGAYGNMVEIDHGCGFRTRYAHMRSFSVEKGDKVQLRQTIGTIGSTGRSTGPHVHYEIRFQGRALNPSKFIQAGRHVYKAQIEQNDG